jgi:hypothetical protein
MTPHTLRQWFSSALAGVIALMLALLYWQAGHQAASRPISSDFYKFYLSAGRIDQGYSMYWLVPPKWRQGDPCHRDTPPAHIHFDHPAPSLLNLGGDTPCLGPNLNPPVFMLAMRPLARLPYVQAWWLWALATSGALMLAAWLYASTSTQSNTPKALRWAWSCIALFAFYPTLGNFSLGQLGGLLLPLFVLAWRHGTRGQIWRSGLYLGLAIALKPFFLVILPCLVAARQWPACRAAIASAAAVTGLGWLIFGGDAYRQYALVAGNISWFGTNWNGSWFGFFDRYFIARGDGSWPDTMALSHGFALGCAGLTFALCGYFVHRFTRHHPEGAWDAVMALGLPMALLVTPLGWAYYLPICTLSWVISWRQLGTAPGRAPRAVRLLLALPLAMAMVPLTIKPSPTPLDPGTWYGLDAWYSFTLVVWFATCCAALYSRQQNKRGPKPPFVHSSSV